MQRTSDSLAGYFVGYGGALAAMLLTASLLAWATAEHGCGPTHPVPAMGVSK